MSREEEGWMRNDEKICWRNCGEGWMREDGMGWMSIDVKDELRGLDQVYIRVV